MLSLFFFLLGIHWTKGPNHILKLLRARFSSSYVWNWINIRDKKVHESKECPFLIVRGVLTIYELKCLTIYYHAKLGKDRTIEKEFNWWSGFLYPLEMMNC